MSVLALHRRLDGRELRRYGAAAVVVLLLYAAVISAALLWYKRAEPQGVTVQAIMIDLPPAAAAQQPSEQDIAVGPEMQEADAPPPEPPKPEEVEQLPPTPPQPEPVVAAPPKVEPKPEAKPVKPQPVKEAKKPTKKPPAPRTTAPQKSDRASPDAPSMASGTTSAASAASYRAMVFAHLRRFHAWPPGSEARGDHGTVTISFTVSRNGRVSGLRMIKSSGISALDQQALAMIQRAQPLPSFPADIKEASMPLDAPLRWDQRRR